MLVRHIKFSPADQWLRVGSTKRTRHIGPKLIFFDLDETLVSGRKFYYRKRIFRNLVAALMAQGSVVGINTNRVLSGALDIYKELNLNGPIIAEGGAVAYLPRKDGGFAEMIPHGSLKGTLKKLLRNEYIEYSRKYPQREVSLSFSAERQFTQSLYIKKRGCPDKKEAENIREYLMGTLGEKGVVIEESPIPGKLHVFYPSFSKAAAAAAVRDSEYKKLSIFMIGDDEAGKTQRPRDTYFLGVKNSAEEYRERCAYVASKPGARGLRQLVSYIEVKAV